MQVESTAEEHSAILLTCIMRCFFEWPLKTGFTVYN